MKAEKTIEEKIEEATADLKKAMLEYSEADRLEVESKKRKDLAREKLGDAKEAVDELCKECRSNVERND